MQKEITRPLEKIGLSLLAAFGIALFAQLRIELPLNAAGIPISGQSFAVLLAGFLLGRRWGLLSVLLYLALGFLGLPVFAGGKAGLDVLFGGSGGYLYGFAAGAWLVGLLAEKGWGRSFQRSLAAMLLGTAVLLFFGLLQLSVKYGLPKALEYGFYPFWPGALIKALLGGGLGYLWHRHFS
ncbi:MAG: biotin transporter BioY [Bacteroidota bacterium]